MVKITSLIWLANTVFVVPKSRDELIDLVYYWGIFIMYVSIGSFVQIAFKYEILKEQMTFRKALVIFVFSFFVCSIINGILTEYNCRQFDFVIIPFCALLSENIIVLIMNNFSKWAESLGTDILKSIAYKIDNYLNKNKNEK